MWNLIFPLYGVNPSTAPLRLQIKLKRAAEWRNRTSAVRLLYFVLVQYCKLSTLSRRPNTVRETSQLFARCRPNVHLLLSQCCAVIQDCGMIRLRDCLVMAQTLHVVITFDLLSFWYRGLWNVDSSQPPIRAPTEHGGWVEAGYPVCEVVALQFVKKGDSEMSSRSSFPKQSYLRQGSTPSSTPRVTLNRLSCFAVRIGFDSNTTERCGWSRCYSGLRLGISP